MSQRHFVDVWNPSYASNAMEAHLAVLLGHAARYDADEADEESLYVWWGKVRSPHRRQPLRHLETALAIGRELDEDPEREGHLYLTDYRSLYVAHVDGITTDDVRASDPDHTPAYYSRNNLDCDFWYKLADIRRLVSDDNLAVIAELRLLNNLGYHDQPVSLYGDMVDLPLIVARPDGGRFFEPEVRDPVTDGTLWAEFDAESGGQGAMEKDLRENLFGDVVWMALEPAARTSIASAEKIFRDHRSDAAFDFAPVIANFSKAMEVSFNAILRGVLGMLPEAARRVNLDGTTVDLGRRRSLTLGEFAHALRNEYTLVTALNQRLEHGPWFTGSLPYIADELRDIRNEAVHEKRVGRETATRIRGKLVGVGSCGVFNELAKVKRRGSTPG